MCQRITIVPLDLLRLEAAFASFYRLSVYYLDATHHSLEEGNTFIQPVNQQTHTLGAPQLKELQCCAGAVLSRLVVYRESERMQKERRQWLIFREVDRQKEYTASGQRTI
jgi:hypothetical protein